MSTSNKDKPFDGILGNSPELKIIEHLIACQNLLFSMRELSDILDISEKRVISIIDRYLKWKIVKIHHTRSTPLFSINMKSDIVEKIIEFSNVLINNIILQDLIEQSNLNQQFANNAMEDPMIIEKYGGKWIAILDQKIVANHVNKVQLPNIVHEKFGEQYKHLGDIPYYMVFIDKKTG